MLFRDEHSNYIKTIIRKRDYLYYLTEQDRMATLYWALNSLKLLKDPYFHQLKPFALKYVIGCLKENGGFGPTPGYTANIISTFNALQILFLIDVPYYSEKTVNFICSLQSASGEFSNDNFGERDTRIDCSAILSLRILDIMRLYVSSQDSFNYNNTVSFNIQKDSFNLDLPDNLNIKNLINEDFEFDRKLLSTPISTDFLSGIQFNSESFITHMLKCNNSYGGFGQIEGSESHAAQTFCCISALRSLNSLDKFNIRETIDFLVFRQTRSGGFNGRIFKKEDVCYSFWVLASLKMLGFENIDRDALKEFIYRCQDSNGGFSDRPGNECDLYHLMHSLSSLSMLLVDDLIEIDPGLCI